MHEEGSIIKLQGVGAPDARKADFCVCVCVCVCVRACVRLRVCVSRKRAKEQQRDEKNRIAQEQRNQKFNELLGLGEREGVS
jgi:hypothetical protein